MKKTLASVLLLFSGYINAQENNPANQFSDSTAIGLPDGKPVSKQIGTAGGTIVSEDGRVELVFPAGALLQNTTISIQPTANPVMQGTGKAYQLEPSGTQFKKPVQFIFHYSKEETQTCPADLMNFALQSHSGKWTYFNFERWDSTAKTLQGYIHHFSGLTTAYGVVLRPQERSIIVDGETTIDIYDTHRAVRSGVNAGFADNPQVGNYYFSVNGITKDFLGGDETVGYAGPNVSSRAAIGPLSFAPYIAPKIMPKQNPVTISLFFQYYSPLLKQYHLGVASCKITVYDEYKAEIIHEYTGRVQMHSKLKDKGSFVVRVFPSGEFFIREIENYPPTVIKEGRNGPFKEKIIVAGAEGTIDIVNGNINDSLSDDYPPEVYFEFPQREITMCQVQHSARGVRGELVTLPFIAIPEEINFIANGQQQLYNVTIGRGETYKLIITPHGRPAPK